MLGAFGERRAQDGGAGRYRFVLPLGQGGTADVYLAVADGPGGFQKLVVLKVLRQSLADDCQFRTMMLSEARLAARLQHPNIVQTYEVIEDGGLPIIVMEFLDGQPLSSVIVRGRQSGFTLAMQVRVLCDALAGLHAAHEAVDFDGTPLGVVHRDVSPHNLFVTVEGQTKVLDFGIAKLHRSLVETEVGTIKGKLRYMAPEQIAGAKLDRRADVYAAGVVLWEALAGERMWKGSPEDEIRARVQAGDLPELSLVPGPSGARTAGLVVPPALARICRRALARSPADRYPTALGLAEDLEATLPALGPAVAAREIGALIARLFADARAETRRAVERTLARRPGDGVVAAPIDGAVNRTREVSGPFDDGTAPGAPAPRAGSGPRGGVGPRAGLGRRRVWLTAIAIAIGIAVAVLLVARVRSGTRPAGSARPDAQRHVTAPPAPGSAPPARGLQAAPGSDDAKPSPVAPGAPVAAALAPHATVARGAASRPPGRDAATRTATASRKHPRGSADHATAPEDDVTPHASAPNDSPPNSRPPPRPADCQYPFFVGPDGIKRFRSECM